MSELRPSGILTAIHRKEVHTPISHHLSRQLAVVSARRKPVPPGWGGVPLWWPSAPLDRAQLTWKWMMDGIPFTHILHFLSPDISQSLLLGFMDRVGAEVQCIPANLLD